MRILLQSILVLLFIYTCSGQNITSVSPVQSCKLQFSDSPILQGYKLGMDISEVNPNQITGKAGGNDETYIKAVNSDSTCYLTFEKKKLKTVTVLYKSLKFDGVDAFVNYLNKTFDLPDTWLRQTPKQIEIERQMLDLDQQLATVVALRNLMFQIHGKNCRQAKRVENEIPKLVKKEARLQEQRQIGSRLYCSGFSLSAFIDNSIEKGVPALHLLIPDTVKAVIPKP